MGRTSIVIADRYPVFLRGLGCVLGAEADFEIVASCSDAASCIEAIRTLVPDIAILDPTLPGLIAPKNSSVVNLCGSSTHLVFFVAAEGYGLVLSSAFDGCSVVLKEALPETLVRSLRHIVSGQTIAPHSLMNSENTRAVLTDRERQIMRLVSEGLSNKQIGRRLNVADGTIKVHLHHVFQKLEISNRTALAALVIEWTYDKLVF